MTCLICFKQPFLATTGIYHFEFVLPCFLFLMYQANPCFLIFPADGCYAYCLLFFSCKIVRLGHPARVYPNLQKHSLDAVLMRSDSAEIIKNVRDDIQTILVGILFYSN